MAFTHGRSTAIYIDGIDYSCYLNQVSNSISIETGETTTFCKDSKTYIPGLADGTISLSGLFDGTPDADVASKLQATTNPIATIVYGGANSAPHTIGTPVATGAGVLTSYEVSSSVGDVISMSAEIQGTDWVRTGRLIGSGSAISATGNEASADDYGATSTTNGGYATLHVFANTRNANVQFSLEDSADNITFAPISGASAFTVTSAASTGAQRVAITGTIRRYTRLAWTVSPGTGSIQAVASIVRL